MSTHTENSKKPGPERGADHPYKITVRSLAGHSDAVTVKPSHEVAVVRDDAVKHFVARGWLTAGDYALTLPRVSESELDPTATFADLGVVEDDVLVLVSRKPQVDG